MKITSLLTAALTIQLAGCVVPPSKTYDNNKQPNVDILSDNALNIDLLKAEKTSIDAKKTWQNTQMFLENGDRVAINAHGSWSPAPQLNAWSGPEGNTLWSVEVHGIPGGALMAKVGHDGKAFLIGTTKTFKVNDYGMLYLAMNDSFSYLFDNTGAVEADIYRDGATTNQPARQTQLDIVSYSYEDATGNGSLSAKISGDHFKTRQLMITKIGEIASSKNIAIKAGSEKLKGGNYELRNESTSNGVLTLQFKTLW